MFANHSKLQMVIDVLRLSPDRGISSSHLASNQHYTCSHTRSIEEKLTGILVILSILALILTF